MYMLQIDTNLIYIISLLLCNYSIDIKSPEDEAVPILFSALYSDDVAILLGINPQTAFPPGCGIGSWNNLMCFK